MSPRCCLHTGLSLPECSCLSCNREKIRRYAPWLVARTPSARRPRSQRSPREVRT